jgi:L-alanine-DL-glutamate epimerase-like enolase superfamily enzyme
MMVCGGNGIVDMDQAREFLLADAFDIIQPGPVDSGSILSNIKIGHMCECFHVPETWHGAMGHRLGCQLQLSSILNSPWQELGLNTPPLLPEEQWGPALKLVNRDKVVNIVDGYIQVPQSPGLGTDINEDAIEHYRVRPHA